MSNQIRCKVLQFPQNRIKPKIQPQMWRTKVNRIDHELLVWSEVRDCLDKVPRLCSYMMMGPDVLTITMQLNEFEIRCLTEYNMDRITIIHDDFMFIIEA